MAGLKIMTTGGYTPRVAAHLLQDNEAQKALNTKLTAGDLRSWKKPQSLVNRVFVPEETKTIFKGKKIGGDDLWLSWVNDVDVIRSPLADNINNMSIYYTGDGVPKKTTASLAGTTQGASPTNWYNLGVPAPIAAPAIAASGGTSVASISITAGGSAYAGEPTVTFTGGGGSGAAATATVVNGVVTGITVTAEGSGYTSAPTISFTGGGGSGAAATAYVGYVQSIAVTAGGTGYTTAPTVALSAAGVGATAQAFISGGAVVAVLVITRGRNYVTAPTVSFSGGGGTGATATATVNGTGIAQVTVTAGGTNYGPVVAISGGGGSGATATARVANGAITDITLTSGGSGYTSVPTVAVTGGGGTGAAAVAAFSIAESRIYCYTYVSDFGGIEEESAPSPISSSVNLSSGQAVSLTGLSARPTSHYNITKIRIYRSATGSSATSFLFVDEISGSLTSYIDTKTSAQLGEALGTQGWDVPPTDLKGLALLPNGFAVGFSKDTVYFSEVNAFHAWPSSYGLQMGYEIVGIGVSGQTVSVMTRGYPFLITGVSPESMSSEKLPGFEPCISKRSITSDASGVMYASPNGICGIGSGMSGVTTNNVMTRDEFQRFNPASFRCAVSGGKYFAFFEQATESIEAGGFILDHLVQATPLSLTTINAGALFVDQETANLYLTQDLEIKEWDSDVYNVMPYEWLSKKFVFSAPANLGAIEVNADFANIAEAEALQARIERLLAQNRVIFTSTSDLQGTLNAKELNYFSIDGSIMLDIPGVVDDRYLLVTLIVDGKTIYAGQYTTEGVYRLPSGYKGQIFEVKINGNIECRYLKLAETVKELKAL